jgi:hypothetical protein
MSPKQPEEAPKPTCGPAPAEQEPSQPPAAGLQQNDALGVNRYAQAPYGRTPLAGDRGGNPFTGRPPGQ